MNMSKSRLIFTCLLVFVLVLVTILPSFRQSNLVTDEIPAEQSQTDTSRDPALDTTNTSESLSPPSVNGTPSPVPSATPTPSPSPTGDESSPAIGGSADKKGKISDLLKPTPTPTSEPEEEEEEIEILSFNTLVAEATANVEILDLDEFTSRFRKAAEGVLSALDRREQVYFGGEYLSEGWVDDNLKVLNEVKQSLADFWSFDTDNAEVSEALAGFKFIVLDFAKVFEGYTTYFQTLDKNDLNSASRLYDDLRWTFQSALQDMKFLLRME